MSVNIQYEPPPTVAAFLESGKFGNFIIGPVGSGKTTGVLFRIVKMAKEQRKGPDGFRRFRAIIVRNTGQQLMDTSKKSWDTWFPEGEAGVYERTNKIFHMYFDDVKLEVWFRPLDTPEDVRRLLSVEASAIVFDEFREIHPDIYSAATGRVGRYPSSKDGGPYKEDGTPNFGVFGATNPPDDDTFWSDFIENPPDNVAIFRQPSGLSPEAENLDHLPDGYYTNLCEGQSEDWINVYVHGLFGRSLSGQPVFSCFRKEFHVSKTPIRYNPASIQTLIVGFDCTGLGPAAVIGQVGFGGRLYIYDELYAEDTGPLRFVREQLKPLLVSKYSGAKILMVVDPAGVARGADEKSTVDLLRVEGFKVIAAKTNSIQARISAVESYLTRVIDGVSGVVIDPACKVLISGLQGKYRYKMNTKGELADTPEKVRPIADVQVSLQYLCLHADGGSLFGVEMQSKRREVKQAMVRFR